MHSEEKDSIKLGTTGRLAAIRPPLESSIHLSFAWALSANAARKAVSICCQYDDEVLS